MAKVKKTKKKTAKKKVTSGTIKNVDKNTEKPKPLVASSTQEAAKKPDPQYYFPRKKCPWCKVDDSKATSTQGNVQYRKCNRVHCNRTFTVMQEILK